MSRPEELYPLASEEHSALLKSLATSDLLFAVVGILGAVLVPAMATLDIFGVVESGSWLDSLVSSLPFHPAGLAVAVALVAGALGLERVAYPRAASYRAAVAETRNGLSGEIVRLPLWQMLVAMVVVGVVEELAFRYALLGWIQAVMLLFFGSVPSVVLAVVLSSVVFLSVHTQYRNAWNKAIIFVVGIVLGALFACTGSLSAAVFAHAAYDIVILLVERRRVCADPGYFADGAPNSVVIDLMREREAA